MGHNAYGQLGDGTSSNRSHPVQVKNEDGSILSEVTGISAGANHTVYLKSDGTVWSVGLNGYGQLGDRTTTRRYYPVQVKKYDSTPLSGVVGISGGSNHTVYLAGDGAVWATGYNGPGTLGNGLTTNRNYAVSVMNMDGSIFDEVVGISAGDSHTVYMKSDSTVWAAGWNNYGQLGDGTLLDRINPVPGFWMQMVHR